MCDPCITAAYYFAVDLTHHRRCIFQTTVYGLRFFVGSTQHHAHTFAPFPSEQTKDEPRANTLSQTSKLRVRYGTRQVGVHYSSTVVCIVPPPSIVPPVCTVKCLLPALGTYKYQVREYR